MFVKEFHTPEQLEALALREYINELTRRIDDADYETEDAILRPPSPAPEYDRQGRRVNTREQRQRRALEVERTLAVSKAVYLIPRYSPPPTLNKLTRSVEKVYLPVRDYPHLNFVGLLLGPRGNALRRMESESGAKISIRGRGSVKEGSRGSDEGSEEDLHCVVSATDQESILKAKELIHQIVDTAIETPEHENDFKRLQLRELAELNGTLRDYENQLCSFCGEPGHRKFECSKRQEAVSDTVCRECGAQGHFRRDCPGRKPLESHLDGFLQAIGATEPPPSSGMVSESDITTPSSEQNFSANNSHDRSESPGNRGMVVTADSQGRHAEQSRPLSAPSTGDSTVAQCSLPPPSPTAEDRTANFRTVTPPSGLAPPGLPPVAPPRLAPPGLVPPGLTPSGVSALNRVPTKASPPGVEFMRPESRGVASSSDSATTENGHPVPSNLPPPGIINPGLKSMKPFSTPAPPPPGIIFRQSGSEDNSETPKDIDMAAGISSSHHYSKA